MPLLKAPSRGADLRQEMELLALKHRHPAGGPAAAAIERAAAELAASSPRLPAVQAVSPTYAPTRTHPLLVSPAPVARSRAKADGPLGTALLAGAAVAFVGGLVWGGVVIATRWDIGFLAWIIGAATGGAVCHVHGSPARGLARASAGLMAAGGILVGKYVIFVHDLRHAADLLARQGLPVSASRIGYTDTRVMGIFIHHFSSVVKPIYGFWILIAFVAALHFSHRRSNPARRR